MTGRTAGRPGWRRVPAGRLRRRFLGRTEDREAGQTTVVLLGFMLVTLLLTITVMAVTSVYVGQRKLQSLADRAAGAAADTFTELERTEGAAPAPVLNHEGVAGAASSYLGTVGAFQDVDRLALGSPTGTPDGVTAQVTLAAVVHPPVVNFMLPSGVPITATGDARAVLGR